MKPRKVRLLDKTLWFRSPTFNYQKPCSHPTIVLFKVTHSNITSRRHSEKQPEAYSTALSAMALMVPFG